MDLARLMARASAPRMDDGCQKPKARSHEEPERT
jgi:hypothetical protein